MASEEGDEGEIRKVLYHGIPVTLHYTKKPSSCPETEQQSCGFYFAYDPLARHLAACEAGAPVEHYPSFQQFLTSSLGRTVIEMFDLSVNKRRPRTGQEEPVRPYYVISASAYPTTRIPREYFGVYVHCSMLPTLVSWLHRDTASYLGETLAIVNELVGVELEASSSEDEERRERRRVLQGRLISRLRAKRDRHARISSACSEYEALRARLRVLQLGLPATFPSAQQVCDPRRDSLVVICIGTSSVCYRSTIPDRLLCRHDVESLVPDPVPNPLGSSRERPLIYKMFRATTERLVNLIADYYVRQNEDGTWDKIVYPEGFEGPEIVFLAYDLVNTRRVVSVMQELYGRSGKMRGNMLCGFDPEELRQVLNSLIATHCQPDVQRNPEVERSDIEQLQQRVDEVVRDRLES